MDLRTQEISASSRPAIAVLVPAHQAEDTLGPCPAGILDSGFAAGDCLVVDDGSTDGTADVARAHGVRVLCNPDPLRPARARNRGMAALSEGPEPPDVVLMVDADVVVHGDVRGALARHFADPDVTAVIGSYDDRADGGSVVSDYRNLLHHWVHQRGAGASDTFWTGIGAVRRDAFEAAGGLRPEWENIEDVEFGLRLTEDGGRIVLDPRLQGTHLKVWTPGSLFRTDMDGRAVPWTRLLRDGRLHAGRLNTDARHRTAAFGVALACLGVVLALVAFPLGAAALLAGASVFLLASWPFLSDLASMRGPGFAARAVPWHALHYVAALAGYAKVRLGLAG
ncbi:glycosyltransferase [Jannaschia sp. LMIT008]|uniref:glycosyltransferase n=1 Tax=Jannaschia maritima TaxID=3032585 RepID=UPI0028123137|nr:glycosyltransferase [Jannaschia sp. LMIT008]